MVKENLMLLYQEAIQHLEHDFNNVQTDTGKTIIADAITEYKDKLNALIND